MGPLRCSVVGIVGLLDCLAAATAHVKAARADMPTERRLGVAADRGRLC